MSQALASATRSTARRRISMLAPLLACSAVERAISHHFMIDFRSEPMSRKAHDLTKVEGWQRVVGCRAKLSVPF